VGDLRVLLHIGTPKTGTTYLQELMWYHRSALRAHGVHYPADIPETHFQAALDLQGTRFNETPDPAVPGAWGRLVRAVRSLQGTVVISHELLGDASAETAARALADLSFANVELVVTLRDLGRQITASWQEDLTNRHYMTFEEYAATVRPGSGVAAWYGDEFWLRQDVPRVLGRWAVGLPPDKVHLITVPPSGRPQEELWHRFATLLDVPPEVVDPAHPRLRRNRSLRQREAQLLRRLNLVMEDRVPYPTYAFVMAHLRAQVLGRSGEPITLPREHLGWVSRCAQEMVDALRDSGHPVIGDLDELLVRDTPADSVHPDAGDPQELLDAAVELLGEVLFDKPPPPLPGHAPPSIARAHRVLWQTYWAAVRARDRARSLARRLR
jgi:hypothetical protein